MKKDIHSPKEKQAMFRKGVLIVLAIALVLVAVGVASQVVDRKTIAREEEETTQWPQDMVEINGIKCTPKKNIKSYLIMGLDSRGEAEATEEYDGTGQVDTLELVVVDYTANTYTRLPINRDTMTEVQSLDTDGTYLATTKMQLSLAHACGDGMEISCENTVDAVSNLLYGQTIDGYASLNMDAIEVLNHLAGGVTVTIEDDFSKADPTLVQGETVTLTDEQAMTYVRGRMDVGDGTNEGRMRRQTQFLSALKPILMEKCQADSSFALEIYDSLIPYMVTDQSRNDFIKLTAALIESEEQERLHIEGTNAVGDTGFNEFTVDEDSLADVVIQLFYDKVEE
ncbi:MAG: LCP family protein [Anaerobutyricum sp.]|nr:LCP family protein [Anaerobutyricum sp.]